jgi:putative tricarboxylic transport membrane protein
LSRRTELLAAALWGGAGTAILIASWRMDRLTDRGINPWSAPGLTPGVVGALMALLALVLAVRALQGRSDAQRAGAAEAASWPSALLALVLCLVFAGLGLGRGLPFAAEAALFIFVFTAAFSWKAWRARKRLLRGTAQAAAVAVVAAVGIAWLFESVFLVRLP